MKKVITAVKFCVGDAYTLEGVVYRVSAFASIRVVSVPSKGSFMYRLDGIDFPSHLDKVRLFESVGVSTVKEFMGLYQHITLYEGVKAVISGYLITLVEQRGHISVR